MLNILKKLIWTLRKNVSVVNDRNCCAMPELDLLGVNSRLLHYLLALILRIIWGRAKTNLSSTQSDKNSVPLNKFCFYLLTWLLPFFCFLELLFRNWDDYGSPTGHKKWCHFLLMWDQSVSVSVLWVTSHTHPNKSHHAHVTYSYFWKHSHCLGSLKFLLL